MMMPFRRQALVEFDSLGGAERCVAAGTSEAVYVAEQRAFFNFSTSQRISRPTNADDPTSRNKVLLLSVQNPLYPITTVSPVRLRPHGPFLCRPLITALPLRTSSTGPVTPWAAWCASSSSNATASRPWWNILT